MGVSDKWGEEMRLIDADELIAWIKGSQQMTSKIKCVIAKIETMPDAVSVVHGEWIYHFDDIWPEESTIQCSLCREHQPLGIDENFCPNCGALMRERESE